MKIICFGDSNTYGYDPRSWLGSRYCADSRWVDILSAATSWTIYNWGENGRGIPSIAPVLPKDIDLFILMLGTNDLLRGSSPKEAAEKLEYFLSSISLNRNQILLIAPPPLTLGQWVMDQNLIDDSLTFAQYCQTLALRKEIPFADAGKWNITLSYDGVHFSEQGHKTFAARLLELISRIYS